MTKSKQFPLPALGIDLRSGETSIPRGAVRRADNVDITADGTFSRRTGYEVGVAGSGFHSMFAGSRGQVVVKGSVAHIFNPDTFGLSVACDIGSEAPVDFAEINKHLFLGNEASLWWIPNDEVSPRRVGVLPPNSLPHIAETNGSLLAGTYSVAVSRVDERGEESATVLVGQIALPNGGGILLSGMAMDLDAMIRVYITPPDGEVMYLSEEFSGAFTTFAATQRPDGATRSTQHLVPMKPGTFLAGQGGRLYSAAGNTLYFSEALRYGLYDPRYNFIEFSGNIRFLSAVDGGLFIGDDRGVWFLDGKEPSKAGLSLASPVLAIRRSALNVAGSALDNDLIDTDADVAVWLSVEGFMVGAPTGTVTPINPEKLRVAADFEGRSRLVVRDGTKQIITLLSATGVLGYGLAIDTIQ